MITVALIGASGYSGAELMRILSGRKDVAVTKATASSSVGQRVYALYPAFAGTTELSYEPFDPAGLEGVDVAFVALPSGEGMKVVPELTRRVKHVIDLGGDFRLQSPELYTQYYKHAHTAPQLLADAVYGLPELNRAAIARARLVANPGCYPTSAILGLLPALKSGIVPAEGIVIDSLSGVSGAGRSSTVDLSFSEVNENIRAYKIGSHQHIPEIETVLSGASGMSVTVSFIPHLVPMTRGIYTTIHAPLSATITEKEIVALYEEFYRNDRFVRIKQSAPQIQAVVKTNFCDIALFPDFRTRQLVIISVIDNLVKGAAGQAVQNMNIMLGLPEEEGLL